MARDDRRDRYRGALLGAAIGDGLGAPFEGMARVRRDALADALLETHPLRFADDTAMTIGLARSLLDRGGLDPDHLAAEFARDFAREPWRGYGSGTAEVLRRVAGGTPWPEASRAAFAGAGSFGNGAAMRVAPVALLAPDDLDRVVQLARASALVTHAHELGVEGAVLQACAVTLALGQPRRLPIDAPGFLEALRGRVGAAAYWQRLDALAALLPGGSLAQLADRLGRWAAADATVPLALYAFLRAGDDYADAVTLAISFGGDTDTVGSMVGALAGARLGEDAIPASLRSRIEGADELRRLADGLLALATGEGLETPRDRAPLTGAPRPSASAR